ncbi:PAS domain S-box protein, partial [bacterium]|nr:PAS domain S-box protein [bacterium]
REVENIKERERTRHIPIIFVTAINKDPFLMHKGYEAGAVDYLFKPFDPGVLRSKVGVFTELYAKSAALNRQTQLLQQSEAANRHILENACDIIATADISGKLTSLSPAFEMITGRSRSDWLGRRLDQLFDSPSAEFALLLKGQPVLFEARAFTVNGTPIDLEVSAKPMLQEMSSIGVIAVMRDVTERREIEKARRQKQELERSNRDLEQFASICSHDLQEPLRVIRTFASLLKEKCEGEIDEEWSFAVSTISEGADRMSNLIRDILTYSQVGGAEAISVVTSASAAFDKAVSNLSQAIEDSKATVTHDSLPDVMATELQLLQLFQNLISNAIKFRSVEPPRIHVSVEYAAKRSVFCVRDNGIGFDMRHAADVFEVFKRLHRTDEYPGTGVGLGICKKIVDRHGGNIWVESKPGEGSRFYFSLPLAAVAEPPRLAAL